ncbi:MAG TPA: M56 family metallopeptidase [Cyclobacteriaceae bacterium]|nr:M56 family metallopeptidase [Cyclobacteriaceae bacterium]
MNTFINYLIEANIGLLLFLLFYKLILNNETNFKFKRTYLVGGLIASLLFPLLKINLFAGDIPSISNAVYLLPEVVVGAHQTQHVDAGFQFFTITNMLLCIYATGVVFFLIRLAIQLIDLYKLTQKFPGYVLGNKYTIIEMNHPFPTFSFFRYIIVGDADQLTDDEKKIIINHERVHVDKLHSIDVLLAELLTITFWFNPFMRTYKKLLTNLHEFQADEKATEQHDVKQYCNLLARVALMSADFKLANHFNNSLTLKRINMMKTSKRKLNHWKVAASAIIVCGFFFVVACQDQVVTEATELAKLSTIVSDLPADVQKKFDELQASNPDKRYLVIEPTTEQGKDRIASLEQNKIASINVITPTAKPNEPVRTFMIIEYNEQVKQIAEGAKTADDVYTIVDQSAEFPGGMDAYYKYLMTNIKYPLQARQQKISGNVFVEFIVQTDGTLTNIKVLKGLDESINHEALRLLEESPKWIPAKQNNVAVKQKLVMPINFILNNQTQQQVKQADEARAKGALPEVAVVGITPDNK